VLEIWIEGNSEVVLDAAGSIRAAAAEIARQPKPKKQKAARRVRLFLVTFLAKQKSD
jgi:hypothetical protein